MKQFTADYAGGDRHGVCLHAVKTVEAREMEVKVQVRLDALPLHPFAGLLHESTESAEYFVG